MSTRSLIKQFQNWQRTGETLVLVTVVATEGSTYSKTGRHLLLHPDGSYAGLVSGGCLEGDLRNHAREVLEGGKPRLVTYDMRDDADDLWGIGLGCNGLMRLMLQRLDTANNWQPFAAFATALADTRPHELSLILAGEHIGRGSVDAADLPTPEDCARWQTRPWIRLLVLGGAPDAVPVVRLAQELGWEITLADHRAAYLQSNDFAAADTIIEVNPDDLSTVNLNDFDAIVVMSHHLETDRKYLRQLTDSQAAYLGLLGPAARKAKLLSDINADDAFAQRLRGPVGLDIGADSPESIALALVGEIQQAMARRS